MPSFSVLHHLKNGWVNTSSVAAPPVTEGGIYSPLAFWVGGAGGYPSTSTGGGGLDTRRLIRARVIHILIHDVRM